MSDSSTAIKLLDKLEGTVIADLKSLIAWAGDFHNKSDNEESRGGLNFTLFILSLIACETFGYYSEGAKYHKKRGNCKSVDTGSYIMDFIQNYFERDSYFKKLKKVLADWLRNYLVHGFGSLDEHDNYDIGLFISKDLTKQILVGKEGEKKVIKLNSIAIAQQTISAFSRLKGKVKEGKDAFLIDNITKAVAQRCPLGKKVLNEFDAVYEIAERKGLTY